MASLLVTTHQGLRKLMWSKKDRISISFNVEGNAINQKDAPEKA